ncbi:MAG TPA: nitrous oxide-stimulated promoter family protein [Woeseiaceae bacterium]|nr:nitrous oxide-stimulated promoter family protein [Woeseiaceae bacterium]
MTQRQQTPLRGRLDREQKTMRHMVALYCRDHHRDHHQSETQSGSHAEGRTGSGAPCAECTAFLAYAARRLQKCPYGEDKPTCANCPVHCYKREPREFARTVMRYSGPRMMWRHPWLALMHLMDGRRRVLHPLELRRKRSADR